MKAHEVAAVSPHDFDPFGRATNLPGTWASCRKLLTAAAGIFFLLYLFGGLSTGV